MLRQLFGVKGAFADPSIVSIPNISIPVVRDIPVLGQIVSGHNLLVYVGLLATIASSYLVFKTRFGLRLRAAGYNADCLNTSGVQSDHIRTVSVLLCGVLCGLAGAFLSLGYVTLFSENMSAGKGWISLAAIILVNGNPWGIALISLIFGFSDGFGLLLQQYLPSQFTSMVPYIATLFALFIYSSRKRKEFLSRKKLGRSIENYVRMLYHLPVAATTVTGMKQVLKLLTGMLCWICSGHPRFRVPRHRKSLM
jgi:simple sugar transport system permease protein